MKKNELKCTDLRIGNWVKVNDPIFGVNAYKVATIRDNGIITLSDNISCSVNNIEPIQLTEEVLLKIGFELANTKRLTGYEMVKELENNVYEFFVFKIFDNNDTLLYIRKQKGDGFEYGEFTKRGIKYLHELQNAYYCLTNEELNIEL